MKEEKQKVVAFWEWGIGNGELVHEVFLQVWDASNSKLEGKKKIVLILTI